MTPSATATTALTRRMDAGPHLPERLPEHLAQVVWRGDAMANRVDDTVIASGHAALDAELPGGGWPCQSMTEILHAQSAQAEWRLLAPALAQMVALGGCVLLIAPPHAPHLPGLHREGLRDDRLIRIEAQTPAERLWATEQALKAGCVSAVLSWLPQVRPEQLRRLHAHAGRHPGLLFVFRPLRMQADSSAAPLRLALGLGAYPHPLQVQIIKRRGPAMSQLLSLPHWPAGLLKLMPTEVTPSSSPQLRPLSPPSAPTPIPASVIPVTSTEPGPHHVALDRLAARESGVLS